MTKVVGFFVLNLRKNNEKMIEISGEEFERRIKSDENYFNNITINFEKGIDLKTPLLNENLIFKNVTFKGIEVNFSGIQVEEASKSSNLAFENCCFLCNILFSSCSLNSLRFISCTINNKLFQLRNCYINDLSFEENIEDISNVKPNIVQSGLIKINRGKISSIDFENIQFTEGTLRITGQKSIKRFTITRSVLNNIVVSNCDFNEYFDYLGNKATLKSNSSFFNHCTFPVSTFFETEFNNKTHFNECTFNSAVNFQSISNEINGDIKFTTCDFKKFTDFDRSKIHKLRFEKTNFHDFVSFQETYFDIIEIDKTNFEKGAFFDDIQIKKIDDCDRRTIRTIKQQLQKAENRIDYNRFRVYEFNAYRKDIKKKLKEFEKDQDHLNHRKREPIQLKRDKFILWISDVVSEYGTDWKRALKFTLYYGLILYCLFFICENYTYKICFFNWNYITHFISGFFRFFLVTDFFNPLDNDRTYLTNPLSWLIFIIGKIGIAFGLYEMIQSFRKFKA